MKKKHRVILVFVIALIFMLPCYSFALTVESNGYAWNSSYPSERLQVCRTIASRVGRSYEWWYININYVYNTNNENILIQRIADIAGFMAAWRENDDNN